MVSTHDEYYFLLLQVKAVFLKLVYFHLDEHFQVNRLLIKFLHDSLNSSCGLAEIHFIRKDIDSNSLAQLNIL